ncbi:MAG: hypothetical protein DKM50_09555 [Candidatus Margulisiibacteriota bacterium]|nr:MAG: hypothetical protein A2X43_05020 [Candidatus Margulisbacteria bacterium GWD2_39_127]OGI02369.1 MAG: hypothetical protein A2X42_09450 [Candidatus Margulisbacteria bacterium GWF2_38_17]OGI08502.1 MAG: hypothetical protein A2X41_07240 [Candidatus Margulisbacteria bacterium GWE2_39_32]PZM79014.1 MAG: hypothetical protein DKM50_09555 [Candidatus Margulisiibacteriota bacterium]HAR64207.1 hypothetical protein [Candidatus Margulisiibacteriota bacterium]
MIKKVIQLQEKWENPYRPIQNQVRSFVQALLKGNDRPAYLVYENKNHFYKYDALEPVFGFNILIRPPVIHQEGKCRHNVNVGSHSLIVFLHADLDKNMQMKDENSLKLRIVLGEDIQAIGASDFIIYELIDIKKELDTLMNEKKYQDLVAAITTAVNEGIKRKLT